MSERSSGRAGRKLVWVGVLVLLGVLAILSAPLWAGGVAAGFVERGFGAERAGSLEIDGLDLAWTGRQAARGLRLFDPEGQRVAEVDVELPSLLALARGGGRRIGEVTVRASAALVADDEGRSNLERALAPAKPEAPRDKGGSGGDSKQEGGGLDELDLAVVLDCPELTWSDVNTRALGAPFRVTNLAGRLVLRPGEPLAVELDGEVPSADGGAGELHVNGELRGLEGGVEAIEGDLEARVSGLPSGLVDALAGLEGALAKSLGPSFELRARAAGGLREGRASLDVKGQSASASFLGELREGRLTAFGEEEGLDLRVADPGPLLERYAVPALPTGGRLAARGLVLSLREFELPIEAATAGGNFDQAALLDGASASFGLTLDEATIALPAIPGGPIEASAVLFSAQVEPERPFVMSLSADLPPTQGGAEAGALDLKVDVLGLEALLAHGVEQGGGARGEGGDDEATPAGWEARLEGSARGLETARLDGLLAGLGGQPGLFSDAVGEAAEVRFEGVWPPTKEPLSLEVEAPGASLRASGVLEDGVLVSKGDPLTARLPLSPLVSQRIVGPLVPMLVQLQKPAGEPPLGLSVSDFRLPLDGSPAGLSATLRLELGEVAFDLLPGLSDVLERFGEDGARVRAALAPLALRIDGGKARYEGFELPLAGKTIPVSGGFDLAERSLDLRLDVPLAVFGSGVARELDEARDYLDPNLAVPLELKGGFGVGKVAIADSFLDTVVKEAASGAVKKGLFDLLEKELGRER